MAEKQERSGDAAKGSSQPKPMGDWPTINLILTDETGSVDYGYDTTTQKRQEDDSTSAGDRVRGKGGWTFDFHTQLALDEKTFDDIRIELRKGTKAGRQKAYAILRKSTAFKSGGPPGKKMIQHALQALSP